MNNMLFAVFFGLGVAGFVYSKMSHRLGNKNGQSVWFLVGMAFLMAMFLFYSIMTWVLHFH